MKKNTRAIFYTMDALLASILLIGAILLIYSTYSPEDVDIEQQTFVSQDILTIVSELRVSELNTSFVNAQIANGNITDINKTVLDQIGEFWAINKADKAQLLLQDIINNSIPNNYGIRTTMGNNTLLLQNLTSKINSIASNRMISGIEQGKPLLGSSGTSYLRKVSDKKTSLYSYFGGFVGQGNITKTMDLKNVTITKIILDMDVAVGGTFQLKINEHICNSSSGVQTFTPSTINMTSDYWDVSSCNHSLLVGKNNFTFIFSDLGSAYISGGYIKIDYETNDFQDSIYSNYSATSLPGIDGAVNLYDSFYVPGELDNLNIYLHYRINTSTVQNTFFMTIGNTTVFFDNSSNGEVQRNLTDANFSMLNYANFNHSTIPIRIGFENITLQSIIISNGEGFGDIVVTTDVSGSMDREFNTNNNGDNIVDCSDPALYYLTTSRISVARCVDKIFVNDVLANTTLNRVGLVSYSDDTKRKFNLTNDQDALDTEINLYSASGRTCIACGVVDAYNILSNSSSPQLHKDIWKYDLDHQFTPPDSSWYKLEFDDSLWPSSNTPFGYNLPNINTILTLNNVSADLWEYHNGSDNDNSGPPNDFTSGKLNNTGNTYGLNTTNVSWNDGWDNATGVYSGNGTNVKIIGVSNGQLKINISGTASRQISDGSYGIQFNVTQIMMDVLVAGGSATVSFDYSWTNPSGNQFSSSDEAWIKARITNRSGVVTYLGTNRDSGADATLDVNAVDDPDSAMTGTFSFDITNIIRQGIGSYYLDFGGKLNRDTAAKYGTFSFDNVQIAFAGAIGNTYYRNVFSMYNLSRFSDARLYVSSDSGAEVYLNNNLILSDASDHLHLYWNNNISVDMSNFVEGDNILAVKLRNTDNVSGFLDIELRANMTGRQSAILIMSDGDANVCVRSWNGGDGDPKYCTNCSGRACCPNTTTGIFNAKCPDISGLGNSSEGNETAFEQLINISCYLHNKKDISLYSVAFGTAISVEGTKTLNLSASCDNTSHFYTTGNVSAIAEIYQDIASSIISGFSKRESQAIVFSGGSFAESTLYPDSYIAYNYTPTTEPPIPGEIEVAFESAPFTECNQTIIIPEGVRIIDAKVTSYSGAHWTDYLSIDGIEVYNLSKYDSSYLKLGDPFIVQIPSMYLNTSGNHTIILKTGDDPHLNTNCSVNNSFIYTALIPSTIARSDVLPLVVGCTWIVESESGDNTTISIPSTYTGTKVCYYTSTNQTYTPTSNFDDAYDLAVYNIFRQLDVDNDGKIIVSLAAEDLEVVVLTVSGLPYMWGPSLLKLEVWQ